MSQYYPPYRSSSNNIKVELDLAMLMLVVLQVKLI